MVALFRANGNRGYCGGTLVSSKYVISAAHCVEDTKPSEIKAGESFFFKSGIENIFDIQVRIGDHDFNTIGEGSLPEMTIDVTSFTDHEDFFLTKNGNDIAILELAEEVDLTTYTPACMAKTSDTTTFDGKNAWAYGEIMMI